MANGAVLPAGWQCVPSRSRPGEFSYLNTATGERVMQRPTRPATVDPSRAAVPDTASSERRPVVKLGVGKRAAGMPSARSDIELSHNDYDGRPPLPSGRSEDHRPITAAGVPSAQYNAFIAGKGGRL